MKMIALFHISYFRTHYKLRHVNYSTMGAGLKCVEPRPTFHEESIGETSKLIASFVFEIGVFVYWFVHLLVSYSIY